MQKCTETYGKFENLTMSYNNRYYHEHADNPDRNRRKDELLDEEAESRTLTIECDVLYQYYEDKVKVQITSTEFDGELTFETTTGNKARQAIDDLEQGPEEKEEKKPEPPKAVPPPSFVTQAARVAPQRPVEVPIQAQQQVQQQVQQAQQNQNQVMAQINPLVDIATDIAEIVRLGAQLKPKIDKLRKK